jgi:hypothetical protein
MNKAQRAGLLLLLWLPVLATAQQGATRVTDAQLEQVLTAAQGKSNARLARRLSGMELTERMSSSRLSSWMARLQGTEAWDALVALADMSAFLDPPPAEIPADPPPELAAQQQMISLTGAFLNRKIPRLPNFFATRTTFNYKEVLPRGDRPRNAKLVVGSLQRTDSSSATVLYRDGFDFVDAEEENGKQRNYNLMDPNGEIAASSKWQYRSMETKGTFGPVLGAMKPVVASGNLTWSRWEQGEGGLWAVFRYAVPKEDSQYEVTYCCLPYGDGTGIYRHMTGYHGEIVINPVSGAILRLTVVADLQPKLPAARAGIVIDTMQAEPNPTLPIIRADIMVEYGPVEIGGKTYTCPLRSVSIMRHRTVTHVHKDNPFGDFTRTHGPYMTELEDVSFQDYHVLRSESRVLPGFNPAPDERTPGPAVANPPAATSPPR